MCQNGVTPTTTILVLNKPFPMVPFFFLSNPYTLLQGKLITKARTSTGSGFHHLPKIHPASKQKKRSLIKNSHFDYLIITSSIRLSILSSICCASPQSHTSHRVSFSALLARHLWERNQEGVLLEGQQTQKRLGIRMGDVITRFRNKPIRVNTLSPSEPPSTSEHLFGIWGISHLMISHCRSQILPESDC